MKQIILIGDSIRMGYQATVERLLVGEAAFWRPEENGGTSANVLSHLDEWVLQRRPDVLHINAGLHDLAKAFDTGRPRVDPATYEANLRTILTRSRDAGVNRIIWALTTPVNEQWHHKVKGFDRFEADVTAYNDIARRVCAELDVPTNDLYEVVMKAGRDRVLVPDGVHFKPEGYELLGAAVAEALRRLG